MGAIVRLCALVASAHIYTRQALGGGWPESDFLVPPAVSAQRIARGASSKARPLVVREVKDR